MVLLHEDLVLLVLEGEDMVGFGDIVEGVLVLDVSKIMKKRFEETLLGSDAVVPGQVVAEYVGGVDLFERYRVSIFEDVLLHRIALVQREDLTVQV